MGCAAVNRGCLHILEVAIQEWRKFAVFRNFSGFLKSINDIGEKE